VSIENCAQGTFWSFKNCAQGTFFYFSCIIQRFTVFCINLKIINMIEHIFKRKAYKKMLQWKQESHGETALLIEGARRVGKSTLVRQFAKNEYD
jgi:hypothetical protein